MSITAASTEQIYEDQLRSDCYALHAARAEVAELQNRHRDIECRYEYLRTVLNNMERSEDNLRRTLAYETATSDAVINAARMGQPLPPALAADAATSVLIPPVHLGKDQSKNIFQTASEVERRRLAEKAQLEKEIADMETVIAAERRSIGTLQHAMYAQAAWGDSQVKKRRRQQMTQAEIFQEIEEAQKDAKTLTKDEDLLRARITSQKEELAAKQRRLQEVEDLTRILSLQCEEVKNALTTGKRDLLRAQTLDAECGQVARIAGEKISSIDQRKKSVQANASSGHQLGASLLTHASGPMFMSALGGNGRNPPAAVYSTQQQQQLPAYPPPNGGAIGDGTHRYDEYARMKRNYQNQQQQQSVQPSPDEINFTARSNQPPFAWTAATNIQGSPQNQRQQQQQQQQGGNTNTNNVYNDQRAFTNYKDAKADANEWLRRYVGSMRGLHLTALETATVSVHPQY